MEQEPQHIQPVTFDHQPRLPNMHNQVMDFRPRPVEDILPEEDEALDPKALYALESVVSSPPSVARAASTGLIPMELSSPVPQAASAVAAKDSGLSKVRGFSTPTS